MIDFQYFFHDSIDLNEFDHFKATIEFDPVPRAVDIQNLTVARIETSFA